MEIRIDTKFLTSEFVENFRREDRRLFKKAYQRALDKLVDRETLRYIPTLYIFPYILEDIIPTSKNEGIRLTSFAMTSVDPADPTRKLAIFAPLYLRMLPFEEIAYTLAHEVAHFVQREGNINTTLDQIGRLIGLHSLDIQASIEEAAMDTYNIFKEPFRSGLIKSDQRVARGGYRHVRESAKIMKKKQFIKYILGDRFQDLQEYIRERFTKTGVLPAPE